MGIKQIANEIFKQTDELKRMLDEDKKIDFEAYLMDKFTWENPTVLDDDLPDSFNDWLEGSDPQEIIDAGQEYAEKIYRERI